MAGEVLALSALSLQYDPEALKLPGDQQLTSLTSSSAYVTSLFDQ